MTAQLPTVQALRYVVPLREGGSLPGIVEADDLGTYVVKFAGAGQGPRVLAAEIIAAHLARAVGLRVPQLALVDLPEAIAKYEADEEAQDLLTASIGINLGSDFLPGALAFEPTSAIDEDPAARILWLDGLLLNIDRSWHNPNLLVWHRTVWCIDHGASLYFHHSWENVVDPARVATLPYDYADHVLADRATLTAEIAARLRTLVTDEVIAEACALVPDTWLLPTARGTDPDLVRAAYVECITARRDAPGWLPAVTA